MAPATLLVLPLLSALFYSCQCAEFGWPPHKELTFSVQGLNVAGLPQLKSQYAGIRYQGEMRVQTHSPRVFLVKLFNMNYTKIHEDLPGWWNGPGSTSRNKTKTLPITTSTIVVKLTKNKSPELVVQSGLDDWQVNMIKGLVSSVINSFGDSSMYEPNSNRPSQSSQPDVFSVTEDSVVGRCEVMYEISPLPRQLAPYNSKLCDSQHLWEITRTRNYSNCQLLSEDHAHLPDKDCTPGGANCGRFWTRASVTQMLGCGEKNSFLLLSSVTSSLVNTHLHLQNNTQAVINSNLNITLLTVLDLTRKFNPPQNKQTINSLLYSYSTAPKDNGSHSGEEEESKNKPSLEEQETSDIDTINKNIKKDYLNAENKGSRAKRGIKRKNGQQSKKESNIDVNGIGNSYNTPNSDENQQSMNSRKFGGSDGSWQKSSGEFSKQPSEELQLEEHWKITGKEVKSGPPYQPFNMFTMAHRTSYDLSCLNPKLRQIIADIASDLEENNILPEKSTLDKLSLAVDICRSLPLDQLSTVSEEVFEVHSGYDNVMKTNERRVFRDVVTMCGTHPALQLIKGWVERQQVEGEEAAEMIASLPSHIFSPTKYLLEDFFEMVQQITEKEDTQLTITSLLALSNLVRDACVSQTSRQQHFSSIIKPVCDESYATRFTEWLIQQAETESHLRRVYIEALGNVGSPAVISILRDISQNSKYSSYMQTSAIFAMRYQVLKKNPRMVPLLMSLYHNYSLPASTRIAAASLLTYARPGLAVWQRLAISTHYDPNPAVAHFVASSLQSMAADKTSPYTDMSSSAYLVQPFSRALRSNMLRPYNFLSSSVSSDLEKIILQQMSWLQFFDYSNYYYRHSSRSCGLSGTNVEASFSSANFDDLWTALKEMITSTNYENRIKISHKNIMHTLANIQESLNLHSRAMPQLQADLHLRINHMMERMLFVEKDTLKNWVKGGRKMISEMVKEGKSLSYQKADMNSFYIATTTELGFPIEFTLRTPWIINAKADFNVTEEGFVMGMSAMYSAQLLTSVGVMSPWDNTAHSAGAYATNFIQLPPFRVAVSLDKPASAIKLETTYVDQHRLMYFSMQPFTSQRKLKIHQPTLLSPDTVRVKLGEPIQMPISWLSRYFKTLYTSEQTESFNPMEFIRETRDVMGFPLMMPNMEARSFETVMNPLHPLIINISMSTATKSSGQVKLWSPKDTILGHIFRALNNSIKLEQPSSSYTPISDDNSDDFDEQNVIDVNELKQSPRNREETIYPSTSKDKTKKEPSTEKKTKSAQNESMESKEQYFGGHQVYSTTYDSATGSFNASSLNPFANTVNGSSQLYLIEQVLSKINSGKAIVFGLELKSTVQDQAAKVTAFATYSTTFSKRASRFGIFVKKDASQVRMTSVHESPVDIATNLKQLVSQDLHHNFFVDLFTSSSGQDMKAFVKATLGASRDRVAQLSASPLLEACSQMASQYFDFSIERKCQELQSQAKEIGHGNITIYYDENAKFLEKKVQMYLTAAKLMLPRTEEKSGEGYNTISWMFDFDQRSESVNTHIKTPVNSINIRRLPLSMIPMSTAIPLITQDNTPSEYCGVSSQRVRTFDGTEIKYRMKDKWHLLIHDCSGKYGISVLAQATNNNSLVFEINLDDQFEISIDENRRVYLNKELQGLNRSNALLLVTNRDGQVAAQTVYTPDDSLHISLLQDQLDLVYSGTSLIIRGKNSLEGRLCGLCGAYTRSGVEQFLTAQGLPAKSWAEFTESYMLSNSNSHRSK